MRDCFNYQSRSCFASAAQPVDHSTKAYFVATSAFTISLLLYYQQDLRCHGRKARVLALYMQSFAKHYFKSICIRTRNLIQELRENSRRCRREKLYKRLRPARQELDQPGPSSRPMIIRTAIRALSDFQLGNFCNLPIINDHQAPDLYAFIMSQICNKKQNICIYLEIRPMFRYSRNN